MMNSISSWCGGLLSGVCAESSLSSCRYPPYVIRSRKSVTTLSSRDMGDLVPPRSVCARAAALLLACAACAGDDETPSQSIPGLVTVSTNAPWASSCTGPAGTGVVFHDAEVEPSVAIDPTDPKHLIGAWQQDRWSNGGSNGVVSAVTFDGGHTWQRTTPRFARTTDGGDTWEPARQIYDPGPDTQTISNQIAVLPGGALVNVLMVAAQNSSTNPRITIQAIRSSTRGETWPDPAVSIAEAQFVGVNDPKMKRGIRSGSVVHSVALDRSSNGTLYVVWEDARFSQMARDGIALSRSIDGGLNWSAPVQVNGASAPAFTPTVAVANGGKIGVTYYDLRRDDPADSTHLLVTHWLAVSTDGGTTFTESMIGAPFNLQAAPLVEGPSWLLGDYQALVSDGSVFLPFFV